MIRGVWGTHDETDFLKLESISLTQVLVPPIWLTCLFPHLPSMFTEPGPPLCRKVVGRAHNGQPGSVCRPRNTSFPVVLRKAAGVRESWMGTEGSLDKSCLVLTLSICRSLPAHRVCEPTSPLQSCPAGRDVCDSGGDCGSHKGLLTSNRHEDQAG